MLKKKKRNKNNIFVSQKNYYFYVKKSLINDCLIKFKVNKIPITQDLLGDFYFETIDSKSVNIFL